VELRAPAQVADELPVLLVPALYIASDALLDWLRRYAEAGGHLVLGPRTGYADTEARARTQTKPALLADLALVDYQEFSNLAAPLRVTTGGALGPVEGAHATLWADGLRVREGASVLARYEHPHHGAHPAIVTAPAGHGRVTTVGTVPDLALGQALLRWLAPHGADTWRALTSGPVTVTSATASGRRIRVVHNWSWDDVKITAPTAGRDALDPTSGDFDQGDLLDLGPWGVRVLVETPTGGSSTGWSAAAGQPGTGVGA
jgi:beta-galactosidase